MATIREINMVLPHFEPDLPQELKSDDRNCFGNTQRFENIVEILSSLFILSDNDNFQDKLQTRSK